MHNKWRHRSVQFHYIAGKSASIDPFSARSFSLCSAIGDANNNVEAEKAEMKYLKSKLDDVCADGAPASVQLKTYKQGRETLFGKCSKMATKLRTETELARRYQRRVDLSSLSPFDDDSLFVRLVCEPLSANKPLDDARCIAIKLQPAQRRLSIFDSHFSFTSDYHYPFVSPDD